MKFRATIRKQGAPDEIREIEAESRFKVYDQIHKEDGEVVSIVEEKGFGTGFVKKFNITIGTGVKRAEIIRLARNLSAMLTAGLSISRGLSVIERQSSNKNLKAIATGLSDAIKQGSSFHEALTRYPKVFTPLFVALTTAGD